MREIEFRGRTAKGEWVYGCLLNDKHDRIGFYNSAYKFEINTVIPETVGQYVGITDKNGKKIFDGDIVKVKTEFVDETLYLVAYKDCGFKLVYQSSNGVVNLTKNKARNIEVIGNIFDKEGDK